jgi:hypothetical protein
MAGRQPFGKVVAGHGGTYRACPVRLPVLVSATAKTLPETSLAAGTHPGTHDVIAGINYLPFPRSCRT